MNQKSKWRVGICRSEYFIVEVDAYSEEQAVEMAFNESMMDPDAYMTGISKSVSSVFINDRESKGFSPYVEDFIEHKIEYNEHEQSDLS